MQSRAAEPIADTAGRIPAARRVVADPASLRRILLVKLSAFGDIIHALPLADALRAALPQVFLGWAVRRRFQDLLTGNPNLDRVYLLESKRPADALRLGAELRAERFDVALDVQGLLFSGVLTRLSAAPTRIGYDWNREGNALWMTHPVVPARMRFHMVDKIMGFCDALGVPRLRARSQTYLLESGAGPAEPLLERVPAATCVGLVVGASTPSKQWPTTHWAELARRLASEGLAPILVGGAGEEALAAEIVREAGDAVALNLVGKVPIGHLASVLARCAVVVGSDTGPTHLAVSVGTAVVGLYGVSDPVHSGPDWGPAPGTILDYNTEAPAEHRRFRRAAVSDALSRIPVSAVCEAVLTLLRLPAPQTAGGAA